MAEKKKAKLADLAQLETASIDLNATQQFDVRALTLREMVILFVESRDSFLPLYAAGLKGVKGSESLAPFLVSSPDLVAKIIAFASDEPETWQIVQKRMPATVQLIALYEIWKLSVPDPKKAQELLSEVMALLQKLSAKGESLIQQPISQIASPQL